MSSSSSSNPHYARPRDVPQAIEHIDKEAFNSTSPMLALRVPVTKLNSLRRDKTLSKLWYNKPRRSTIVDDPQAMAASSSSGGAGGDNVPTKLLLLSEEVTSLDSLEADVREKVAEYAVVDHTLEVGYDDLSYEQVMRKVLPEDVDVPTGFETVGHIAHFNLRDAQLPYKKVIGEVLLDKTSKQITTVVNKLSNIHNVYRFFEMEVIAGEPDLVAEVRENDCDFRLDFSTLYWNSRLHREHERVIKLTAGSVVCDMFAGIGPFAVPAAKGGATVYANDLNPMSYHYLKQNAVYNGASSRLVPFNLDARDFMRLMLNGGTYTVPTTATVGNEQDSIKPYFRKQRVIDTSKYDSAKEINVEPVLMDHIVMNLPATAIEFVDVFRGGFVANQMQWETRELPMVHCYCFSNKLDAMEDARERVEAVLGASLEEYSVHDVRDVAPKKRMLCVSFRVPSGVAFDASNSNSNSNSNSSSSSSSNDTSGVQVGSKRKDVDEVDEGQGEGDDGEKRQRVDATRT